MVLCLKNSVQKNEKKNDGIENTNIGPLLTKKKHPERTHTTHTRHTHNGMVVWKSTGKKKVLAERSSKIYELKLRGMTMAVWTTHFLC